MSTGNDATVLFGSGEMDLFKAISQVKTLALPNSGIDEPERSKVYDLLTASQDVILAFVMRRALFTGGRQ